MNIISWFQADDDDREEFLENDEGSSNMNRYSESERERYDVEDVPLTMYERGVTAQALKNEIDYWERKMKNNDHPVPERISLLRNALQSLEQYDGTESWGPARCEQDKTGFSWETNETETGDGS